MSVSVMFFETDDPALYQRVRSETSRPFELFGASWALSRSESSVENHVFAGAIEWRRLMPIKIDPSTIPGGL